MFRSPCLDGERDSQVNGVDGRCKVLDGDNRAFAPAAVADRVLLGLLPSSESGWATAVRALRPSGTSS
jgi:tRNA G37 N-methylase Trm5